MMRGTSAAGDDFEAIQEAFALSREQVLDALRYAAHVAEHLPPAVTVEGIDGHAERCAEGALGCWDRRRARPEGT